jgi:lipopolysaccharide/colanic/teichoic acid biosynthesis glycosyltransferase
VNLRSPLDPVGADRFVGKANPSLALEVLSESAFHQIISLERRRTERSRKPFLLMLLDMGDRLSSESMEMDLKKLLAVLSVSTRETDVAGWYKSDWVAGVLFTEIAADDRESIVAHMMARIGETLRKNLSAEQFDQVRVSFHVFPEDGDQDLSKRRTNPLLYPDLSKQADAKRFSSGTKRTMDIVGSATALMLGAPLFLCIALAIKATSKGPVFFRQQRIGQHGEPFLFLKFRSMYIGNDASIHKEYVTQLIAGKADRHPSNGNGEGVFKLTKDPRITRVGSFLRRTSLDELPQFINVLKGDMSLVGPRPPVAYEVEAYDLWHRRRLVEAKPGITGLWQVSGRSRVKFDDMVRLDLEYARSWSPWMDIKILLRTPLAVLFGEGAH